MKYVWVVYRTVESTDILMGVFSSEDRADEYCLKSGIKDCYYEDYELDVPF